MVRIIFLFLSILLTIEISVSATPPLSGKNKILYEGIYMSTTVETAGTGHIEYRTYMRFYPDKKVILITSDLPIEDIKKSLTQDGIYDSSGAFKVQNGHISFSAISGAGKVDYTGKIIGKRLELDIHSHINQYRGKEIFIYVE